MKEKWDLNEHRELDAQSAVPLYIQLRGCLRAGIINRYPWIVQGNRVLPEETLAKAYGVSRETVRRAIAELVSEGVLTRSRSHGTFVKWTGNEHWLDTLDEYVHSGIPVVSRRIAAGFTTVEREVIRRPLCPERLIFVEQLRSVAGKPVALDKIYFPETTGQLILRTKPEETLNIWRLMESESRKLAAYTEDSIRAVTSAIRESHLLNVSVGTVFLMVERTVYDDDNWLLTHLRSLYRVDRYQYLAREPSQHLEILCVEKSLTMTEDGNSESAPAF